MAARSLRTLEISTRVALVALGLAALTHCVLSEIAARDLAIAYNSALAISAGGPSSATASRAALEHLPSLARLRTFVPLGVATTVAAALAFVVWVRTAFVAGASTRRPDARLASPLEIVVMWLVPIINLFMPFWYLRDLLGACDPSDLDAAPAGEVEDLWTRPWIPFRAWWALWVVVWVVVYVPRTHLMVNIFGVSGPFHFEAARSLLSTLAAVACALVLRGTTEVIAERARRLGVMANTAA
jgi:hypothetical protein